MPSPVNPTLQTHCSNPGIVLQIVLASHTTAFMEHWILSKIHNHGCLYSHTVTLDFLAYFYLHML